jgi:hypothetical protein
LTRSKLVQVVWLFSLARLFRRFSGTTFARRRAGTLASVVGRILKVHAAPEGSPSAFGVTPEVDQSGGLTRSVAKTDRAMEAWYHPSIA